MKNFQCKKCGENCVLLCAEDVSSFPKKCPWAGIAYWEEIKGIPDQSNPPPPEEIKLLVWSEHICPKCEHRQWFRFTDPGKQETLLNEIPPPGKLPIEDVVTMRDKCDGCLALFEVTGNCALPGRCKEPGQRPVKAAKPPEEIQPLVTVDDCLRVIDAHRKAASEADWLPIYDPDGEVPVDEYLKALREAAIKAAKALQLLLSVPLVRVSGEGEGDE
jgi:hypothetical protein